MEETALLTACAINLGTSGSVPDREASVYYWLGLAHERLAQQLSVEGVHVRQHHHTLHTRRLTDRYTETLAHLHTHTHTERERERERHTHTHRDTERERQRDRQRESNRETQRKRHRERDRETQKHRKQKNKKKNREK